ncbi:MAG: gliding motility-associated C-terminal domain-containing protein, partial [Sphingobacterium sp.]|nr:gliding motility-associated C-terminal domain-containing protein [Sphingobacterium sp.]
TGELSRDPGEDVGSYEITIGDLTAGDNYEIVLIEEKMLTIKPAPLEVSAVPKSKVFGEADPALTFTVRAIDLKNGDTDAVVTGSLIRELGEDAGTYKILQDILTAGANYEITYVGADFTITAAAITITPEAKSKVYGTSDPALTYITEDASGTVVDLSTVMTGQLSRVSGEDVGSYEIEQGSLSAGPNYTITFTTGKKLTITKATLTGVTFESKEFVYDGTVKRLELKGNIPGGAEVKYTNNDQVNAGTYKVTAEIVATTNYEGATYDATMVIHKAKQTIVFKAPTEVALEEEAVPLDVYATSGLPVTLLVNDPLIASVTGTVLKPLTEGTVQITATQPGDDNYEAATPVTVSIKIVKKNVPLNVRPHKAVSPNYDGINEFFKLDGIEYYPDNKVTIFDKNGVVMAEIVGYNNQDKRYTGELHRDGTYYYYLDVKENGVWRREKGYFVVRR